MSADERKRVILITGASTGIGLALCRALSKDDTYITIATARPTSLKRFGDAELNESEHFIIRSHDVTCPGHASSPFDEIEDRWGGVDILVKQRGRFLSSRSGTSRRKG
tara:strand:+ start:110 stop:433 length:324 start_codon:yes stop_codon:yes gene_type:complete